MHHPSIRSLALSGVVASVALVAGLSGCLFSPKKAVCTTDCVVVSYRPLTSYGAPLFNLKQTYDQRGTEAVDHYRELIASSYQFRYYDAQSPTPTIPQYWGYSEEIATATGLLTDNTVSRLELIFPLADTTSMVLSSVVNDPDSTMKITINGINLQVQKGDFLYQTNGSADFYIARINGTYQIIRWEDNTAPPASPRPARKGSSGTRAEIARAVAPRFLHDGDALREAARLASQLPGS